MKLYDTIPEVRDNSNSDLIIGVFPYMSRALDTINHEILTLKLNH